MRRPMHGGGIIASTYAVPFSGRIDRQSQHHVAGAPAAIVS
jgi:hypothetical protein